MGCYKMSCKCGHTFCYECGGPTQDYFCPTCTEKAKANGGVVAMPALIARPAKKLPVKKIRGAKRK